MEKQIKPGFIGCGNMGGVLAAVAAKAFGIETGEDGIPVCKGQVLVADHNESKMKALAEQYGCIPSTSAEIAKSCDLIFLGVKPQVMKQACLEIIDILGAREDHFCIISMAAGLTIGTIRSMLDPDGPNGHRPACPVMRIMPNTPCSVGAGVILYSPGEGVRADDEEEFLELMRPAGIISRLEESKIDMGSALSGCGPAYVYMFIDALTDGGVRCGLPREKARRFAIQTVLGSALMCGQSGQEPAKLKGDVCSPAGSTIEGVAVLEEKAFRSAVMDAVYAAYKRNVELGKV
jgi:pyrroline-5-carboxylate reductase